MSRELKNRGFFRLSILGTSFLIFYSLGFAQNTGPYNTKLKQAAELFMQRKYDDALPILEQLAADHPNDDQVVFGLGVALIMKARGTENGEEREKIAHQAHSVLQAAIKLGVEDFFLDRGLNNLSADTKYVRMKAVNSFATLWTLHPPLIFDNQPPLGIRLPEGYRHKNSRDFEGMVSGLIWKPGRLRIKYAFDGMYQSDVVQPTDENTYTWYEEKRVGDHKFKCALAKQNHLIISVLFVGAKESPIATFYCDVKDKTEIADVLSIVTGLKETSSFLLNK